MISDKGRRFLNSISIENCEEIGIDIKRIFKGANDTWNITCSKSTPWNIDIIYYFFEHLDLIKYKYKISYVYPFGVCPNDVLKLLNGYLKEHRIADSDTIAKLEDDKIVISPKDKTIKYDELIQNFNDLLRDISYPLVPISCLNDTNCSNEENSYDFLDNFETESIEITNEDIEDINSYDHECDFIEKKQEEVKQELSNAGGTFQSKKQFLDKLYKGLKNPETYKLKKLHDVLPDSDYVLCSAKVFSIDKPREVKDGVYRYTFGIHDESDSLYLDIKTDKNIDLALVQSIEIGSNITFTGTSRCNVFTRNETHIQANSIRIDPDDPLRDDPCNEKRVELHLHTNMSALDGLPSIDKYCELASHMGMKAIAVTDHGCVQSFPAAQRASKKYNLKMIYGCEMYIIDDFFTCSINPSDQKLSDVTYVVFDLETTGLSIRFDSIIEFGAVKIKNGLVLERMDILINPGFLISEFTTKINNITNEMLERKPSITEALKKIIPFINGCVLVSHNLKFDFGFLNTAMENNGFGSLNLCGVDTLTLSQYMNPECFYHSLGYVCRRFDIEYLSDSAHRADYDAEVLSKCWMVFYDKLLLQNPNITFKDIGTLKKEQIHLKHSRETHVIVLVKNKVGLKELYKLVSYSNIECLGRFPCVPRSLLEENRENFIIGSACFNGKVFTEASTGSEKSLYEAIQRFDYVELQPKANYSWLINTHKVKDERELDKIINSIIDAAHKYNKMIVATGDCHYLNPSDKIFRDVLIAAPGLGKSPHPLFAADRKKANDFPNPDQHFRSTQEMLDAFECFGKENAYDWVIKNSNIIANQIDSFDIIEDRLFTPTIKDCDKQLEELCYSNAHKLYGDVLPSIVDERLKKELNGIIGAGYYVTYYIAYKIIKKTHDDGYIVGSRGSVGSSFAATMAGITEVNPLPPHYRCPKCRHFELYEGDEYLSGYDLPEKRCPECGEIMIGDGQNIPFETFLGFNADKVPDIDLNFPPDYQSRAHDYTKVLLGENNVYRAGTISTASDKTAFGYARGFLERTDQYSPSTTRAEISYLSSGCINVKRTTGQHPGGIVVIPDGYDVYDFTPVQFPADKIDAEWKTTHFEFESIHDTLLKLDLLGHVDPQAIKMLTELSGIKETDVPFNDKQVLKLFTSPEPLHLQHNYLGVENGAVALPEFGTETSRGLLMDAQPKTFADLIIISGVSHGTGVWKFNAQSIIKSKIADLHGVIGCRDDIMTYLISKGLPNLDSFKIMEKVRHGRGLDPQQEMLMRSHDVPEYYIKSCKKIQYLFPKAHATAYVSNAIRVAWFKVYKPLEFYATYFSVRVDKYDWDTMLKGPEAIMKKLDEFNTMKRGDRSSYSKTNDEVVKCLVAALEYYDRGFVFGNLSITKSEGRNFVIDREKGVVVPSFAVIDGLGETAAASICNARNDKPFTSVEDFLKRVKINNTQLDKFRELNVFEGLPEEEPKEVEQLTLF